MMEENKFFTEIEKVVNDIIINSSSENKRKKMNLYSEGVKAKIKNASYCSSPHKNRH
jgi:hypothetical protein